MKKTVAVFALLAALVGSASAFAADPCGGCKGQHCNAQSTFQAGSGLSAADMKP